MPQIIQSNITSINAQRRANDKDRARWDANTYLQSAATKKQITTADQKYADDTEAGIQAGILTEGSTDKYGNKHRVFADWGKPDAVPTPKEEVAPPIEPPMPPQPEPVPGPSGSGQIQPRANYGLGNVGVGKQNHISNQMFGNPYTMSPEEQTQLSNITPALTPQYFNDGGKIKIDAGHDATPFSPANAEALRQQLGKPDLTDEELQYMLATSRGYDMSRTIGNELLNKGVSVPLKGIQINPYKGDQYKNPEQRFSGFGLSGEYSDSTKKVESKPTKAPKGSTPYDESKMTPAMLDWKKTMESVDAYLKVQNPVYRAKAQERWRQNKEKKGAK